MSYTSTRHRLIEVLAQEYDEAHYMCTNGAPLDEADQKAWVEQHIAALDELVADFVATRF